MRCVRYGAHPLDAHQVGIAVRRDAAIGGRDDARRRIENAGQLVEGKVAGPLVGSHLAGHGQRAVAGGAQRNRARRLVADVAVDIGIDDVLAGRAESATTRREIPASSAPSPPQRRHVLADAADLDDPLQCELAPLARDDVVMMGPWRVI